MSSSRVGKNLQVRAAARTGNVVWIAIRGHVGRRVPMGQVERSFVGLGLLEVVFRFHGDEAVFFSEDQVGGCDRFGHGGGRQKTKEAGCSDDRKTHVDPARKELS